METENPSPLAPQQAWDQIIAGNRRFANGTSNHPHLDEARRSQLTNGQNPSAVIIACSDSRVPVELIFDAGLGDIFVVRTAGPILGESVMGSVSFAVNSLEVPLVIVLGHESCGAVAASVDALDAGTVPDDHRRVLVERVSPSILMARAEGKSEVFEFERRHAAEVARQLMQRMPRLQSKVIDGEVGVVAARYLLGDGIVEAVAGHGVETGPELV